MCCIELTFSFSLDFLDDLNNWWNAGKRNIVPFFHIVTKRYPPMDFTLQRFGYSTLLILSSISAFGFLILLSKARLLRATFYILTKQQDLAMEDLTNLIGASFRNLMKS